MLEKCLHGNKSICLNTQYQKILGQTWTHTSPNNFKSQIDFIIINSKWENSSKKAKAYNSFISLAPNYRFVSANIKLSLRKKVSKTKLHDLSSLKCDAKIKKYFHYRSEKYIFSSNSLRRIQQHYYLLTQDMNILY